MSKQFKLIFLFLLLLPLVLLGQSEEFDVVFGIEEQRYLSLELGIASVKRNSDFTYSDVHICAEALFTKDERPAFGGKIGFDRSFFALFQTGIQLGGYGNRDAATILVRPEVGVTFFGFFDVLLGYNVFIVKENMDMSALAVAMRIKIPHGFFK